MLAELAGRRPRGIVFDIGSLKTPLRSGLEQLRAAGCHVTSVHPMFGPDTELLSGRHVIFIDLGHAEALAAARTLFASTMAEQVVMGPDEHDRLIAYVESKRYKGVARITEAFRVEYYKLVKRILEEEEQVIDCYAGWASAQIYADGTVWPCCVRADNLGNLRDHDYDFKAIWFGDKIKEVRRSIAAKECYCPLANASYTNMLIDPPTLTRVGLKVISPD